MRKNKFIAVFWGATLWILMEALFKIKITQNLVIKIL